MFSEKVVNVDVNALAAATQLRLLSPSSQEVRFYLSVMQLTVNSKRTIFFKRRFKIHDVCLSFQLAESAKRNSIQFLSILQGTNARIPLLEPLPGWTDGTKV